MLVFLQERLVLLSVPKTGTTALEGALSPRAAIVLRDPPNLKHAPLQRMHRVLASLIDQPASTDFETVAVVRHPVDWLSSWYRYRHRDELRGKPNSTFGLTFDDFVLEYCKTRPARFAAVGSQANFLAPPDGKLPVTHLFRYEAQPLMLRFLEKRLKKKIKLNQLNVSPVMEAKLSPEVESKFRDRHAAEFEIWERAQS